MDLISICRKGETGFSVSVRSHEVMMDMASADGGNDSGPSPVEFMVSSLGACVAIMVQRYCSKHGYVDGNVEVNLTYQIADKPKRIEAIFIDLELPKDVPENRLDAIRRVAELCPVHATLSNAPMIDIEIV